MAEVVKSTAAGITPRQFHEADPDRRNADSTKPTNAGAVFADVVDGPVVAFVVDDLETALREVSLIATDRAWRRP
jgi:hypothetical protein